MANRTVKRSGMYTDTGRGSAVANAQKAKGASIITKYKGLQDNKNDVTAVQDSLADVNNLYIDDNNLLSSRPPMKSYSPIHDIQEIGIVASTSVRMWNIEGYIFRLLRRYKDGVYSSYIVCDNKIPVVGGSGEIYLTFTGHFEIAYEQILFTPIEDKIFIWIGPRGYNDPDNAFWYFDIKTNRFIQIYDNSDETYIYRPIVNFIDNGIRTKTESLNVLNPLSWRDRYKYGIDSNIDFSSINTQQVNGVRAYSASDENFISEFDLSTYPNNDISPVLLYPRGLIKTPDYYDVVEHENGVTIMCYYAQDKIIRVSTDGKNYSVIQNFPTGSILGHPYLSRDGSTVILFTADDASLKYIYFANVLSPTTENYMSFEEHNYFENGTAPTIVALFGFKLIAYFYNETIYAYAIDFNGSINGVYNSSSKILCISHMRSTQRVDVINKTNDANWDRNIVSTDKIMMCPRRMTEAYFVIGDGYYTQGPVYLITLNGRIQLHSITYANNSSDPDDISFIHSDYKLTSGYNDVDIFDLQDYTATNNYRYTALTLSEFPTYYYDENNKEQADVYLTAIYRQTLPYTRIQIRYGYVSINKYPDGYNSYTNLKRARYNQEVAAGGEPSVYATTSVSLSRVYFMVDSTLHYLQKYYKLADLPSTPYSQVAAQITSSVKSYSLSENQKHTRLGLTQNNNLWGIYSGSLWTTALFNDTKLYLDVLYGSDPLPLQIPIHFASLQEYYFAFENLTIDDRVLANPLAVTATRRNDKNEFLLYLPLDDVQECINEITNLCPISSQTMAVFLEDSIWYASMDTVDGKLVHKKLTKSKIPFGCKKGTDVLVTSDGQSVIFPTYRGIALLGPQDFVATTDPIIKYISDNIQNTYLRFYTETMKAIYQTETTVGGVTSYGNTVKAVPFSISFVTYKYWIFMYKRNSREILLYDMRDNTWWTWTLQYPVIDLVVQDRLYALLNTPEYATDNYVGYEAEGYDDLVPYQVIGRLFAVADKEADLGYVLENFPAIDPAVDDFSYEDKVFPDTFNGDVRVVKDDTNTGSHIELSIAQSRIDWYLISQKLYLDALNNYKSIVGINIVAKGLYEYGTKLTLKTYRNVLHPEESLDMDIYVKDLRTFVQRLNLWHTIFFQYKLENTKNDKQRQAHIASLCVKYEVKEGIR